MWDRQGDRLQCRGAQGAAYGNLTISIPRGSAGYQSFGSLISKQEGIRIQRRGCLGGELGGGEVMI